MNIINDTFNCGVRTVIAQPEGVCSQMVELKIFGDDILPGSVGADFGRGQILIDKVIENLFIGCL